MLILVAALLLTPMVLATLGFALALPIMALVMSFGEALAVWKAKQGAVGLSLDFLLRSGGLAVMLYLIVKAWQVGLEADIVYLALLVGIGSFAGELTAMLLYVVRRRKVENSTNALLSVNRTTSASAR